MWAQNTGGFGANAGQQAAPSDGTQFDNEIQHPFTDAISCLKFAPLNQTYQSIGSPILAAASFDGNIVIYRTQDDGKVIQAQFMLQTNAGGPVLGICWQPDAQALLIACADNNIKRWDLGSNSVNVVGQHKQPVKDIYCFSLNNQQIVVSGGWDARVKFWNWNQGTLNQIGEAYVAKPVHYMSGEFPLLVTAHSELHVHYWNLNNIIRGDFNPAGLLISPLKQGTTSICCFPDAKGFAIGSIEGRCGIKYLDINTNNIVNSDDFCFKCHRQDDTATTNPKPSQVYAVNGIVFNKQFGSFATLGQDGSYYFWNKDTKSKLRNTKAPNPQIPLTSADFLDNAQQFAYAYGYDWGKGAEESKKGYPTKLVIRKVQENEVLGKKKV
eukprot:403366232